MSCLQLCIDFCSMSIFLKRNLNLILAFDLRIFYCVPKGDCNISMIVFQTTIKLCSKVEIISSSQSKLTSTKKYDRRCQKQLCSSYKIRSDFFSVGFYIFEVFCSLLSSRRKLEDGQTETIFNVSEVNELLTTYAWEF